MIFRCRCRAETVFAKHKDDCSGRQEAAPLLPWRDGVNCHCRMRRHRWKHDTGADEQQVAVKHHCPYRSQRAK